MNLTRSAGATLLLLVAACGHRPPIVIGAAGPTPVADSLIAVALDRAKSGDTSAAIQNLDWATEIAPDYARAHYERGIMLSRATTLSLGGTFRRRSASNAFERALDLDPENPLYLLELGRIRLKTPFMRLMAQRLFRHALEAAEKRGDKTVLAEVQWELGQIYERRYMTMANRRLPTAPTSSFGFDVAVDDWHYTRDFFELASMPIEGAGELDYGKAEQYFRQALASDSTHTGAAVGLLALLADGKRYEEMVAIAQALLGPQPNEPRIRFALGLALHRLDRDNEASVAFNKGVSLLSPDVRRDMLSLERLLRRDAAMKYLSLNDSARDQFDDTFWTTADPLRLTPTNEYRVEFLSRVAYTDLRFSSPEFNLHGWKTDRGDVWIRYGPPPLIGTLAPEIEVVDDGESMARVTTIWYYPDSKMRFVFVGPPAMNTARFAGDFFAYAEDQRYLSPASFSNLNERFPVDSVPVQVASFRGDKPGVTDVSVFASIPAQSLLDSTDVREAALETGFFLLDGSRRTIVADRDTEVVRLTGTPDAASTRTWRRELAPGEYMYRVEARQPVSGKNARGRAAVSIGLYPAGLHKLSDILVARHIGFKSGNDKPTSRDDLLILPTGSLTFAPGDTLYLYWESYGLQADSTGVAHARVNLTLHVDSLHREGSIRLFLGGIKDAIGLSAEGQDRVTLRYDRSVPGSETERSPDFIALALGSAPEGSYTLEIQVEDLVAKETATTQRELKVLKP